MTDKQTLNDLNIFGHRGDQSIYGIFDKTATRIGAELLEEMFYSPLSEVSSINERSAIFQYFSTIGAFFPFQKELFDIVERYLSITDERTRLPAKQPSLVANIANLISEDNEYKTLYKGVTSLIEILQNLHSFSNLLEAGSPYEKENAVIRELLATEGLSSILQETGKGTLPYERVVIYDNFLRFRNQHLVRRLLRYIYQLDVYIAVGKVAIDKKFVFPRALPANERAVRMRGIFHPEVKNAIPNSLDISAANHVLFLTGANMAGKSTFMKTLGIALLLAHMGFPVPAEQMEFSVLDGIYMTINLPDDLGMGASHFYAEVQRIKKIALELGQGRRLFVVFDELFRGTNVKDAYEATIALTKAFAGRNDSFLLLSTHIIEAGELLTQECSNIDYIYLPTRMEGDKPVYTYKLEKGITADRHGMVIVNNEGILDILSSGRPKADTSNSGSAGSNSGSGATIGGGFTVDQQTMDDLNIGGRYKPGSIYSLFNQVRTLGGERLLDQMFRQPLSDAREINDRSSLYLFLQGKALKFPFSRRQLILVEEYLHAGVGSNKWTTFAAILRHRIMGSVVNDENYELVRRGIQSTMDFIDGCRQWFGEFDEKEASPLRVHLRTAKRILDDARLKDLIAGPDTNSLSWQTIARYHHILGYLLNKEISIICGIIYELDLGITVSDIAREKNFTFAQALPKRDRVFWALDLRHPSLEKGVGNTVMMAGKSNVIFLTGANMAGKSTLMKSFGIAVYLAHMGFPVAAQEMAFSVKEGLYSSINISDNLSLGYSHFYAEVQRVKRVAEEVSGGRDLVVIFDELFKGTNVKDAYDATLAVSKAFLAYNNCLFLISTHITEVGEKLAETLKSIQFRHLPTIMNGSSPTYTYRLEVGISKDHHGMMIMKNEGILEILASAKSDSRNVRESGDRSQADNSGLG